MKAVVNTRYGLPDVLQVMDIEKPVPNHNEVLIKTQSVSVNSWDWDILTGKPYLYRLMFGLLKPKLNVLGADVAGVVEAVGKDVSKFNPGDEVFGDISNCKWGGFAEYVCATETALTKKPTDMSFDDAASIPQAAVLALQGLRDRRPVAKGQKVLINGAGGGVGTFALQIAKYFGAEVTCVDSTEKLEMLSALGADHVIDFRKEDFTKNGLRYDLIVDVVANRSIFSYGRSLLPNGIFALIGGTISSILQTAILGPLLSKANDKTFSIVVHSPNKDIPFIISLFESGDVIPVIDKRYPLEDTAAALRYFGEGRVKGKVIIKV